MLLQKTILLLDLVGQWQHLLVLQPPELLAKLWRNGRKAEWKNTRGARNHVALPQSGLMREGEATNKHILLASVLRGRQGAAKQKLLLLTFYVLHLCPPIFQSPAEGCIVHGPSCNGLYGARSVPPGAAHRRQLAYVAASDVDNSCNRGHETCAGLLCHGVRNSPISLTVQPTEQCFNASALM